MRASGASSAGVPARLSNTRRGEPQSDQPLPTTGATARSSAWARLKTLVFHEAEVRGDDGHTYLTRILPYRTDDDVIEGLVITFVDVTRVKGLQERSDAILAALASSPTTVFGQDTELRYTWVCSPIFGIAPEQAMGRSDCELLGGQAAPLEEVKRRVLAGGGALRERVTIGQPPRAFDLYLEARRDGGGTITGLSGVMTEQAP